MASPYRPVLIDSVFGLSGLKRRVLRTPWVLVTAEVIVAVMPFRFFLNAPMSEGEGYLE